ncbi:MAG: class I SAM-dependent methyltransferase [Moorea sp. SIOASIH]|uniref:class I SAM-dependent methyltransferase n=1 Tax=Moorena sp. SIOASIH TaxID=2607817 RepID=UPI0013BD21E2|nr:class I SAM-dependent methyltransferase [Moorena sp. SIOASIH]NEO36425.1 class I SAM-dependent methyltransferase [Moorena sp. SIOASIH]
MMTKKFTEADTQTYYDNSDDRYRISWHPDGSKHWGYFDNLDEVHTYEDFLRGCDRWNEYMLEHSGISAQSRVLEVGCGNGKAAVWIAQQKGCEVVGIDLSATHIRNCEIKAKDNPSLNLSFEKASILDLPFPDESFTHAWSQGTLLHIEERGLALKEISRVLKPQGRFVFDDLTTPTMDISESTRKHLYERLLVNNLFTPESYRDNLSAAGFKVLEATDLSQHMQKSYALQSERIREQYPELSVSYGKSAAAVEAGELGWYFFECEKVGN